VQSVAFILFVQVLCSIWTKRIF